MTKKHEPIYTSHIAEKAFLISVATKGGTDKWAPEASVEELAQLATSAGAKIAGRIIQRLNQPSSAYYLGRGKLKELSALRAETGYDLVIADDELTPLQQQNVEEELKVKVLDRVALILDIFARRARTREGQLQVELAQYQYLLPRLAGRWRHLERLGGGIGTRGPGESQLESDRRLIRKRIQRLEEQIDEISRHRALYRERRRKTGVPVVALVGYTNAGKSTLFNALGNAGVLAEERPFSTLDPTTRRVTLPDKTVILLTDTVGFIRKLPPTIVTAFRATLEELREADLLIHVVDFSSPRAAEQCETVEEVLGKLSVRDKPRLTVLNKIDLVLRGNGQADETATFAYLSKLGAAVHDEHTVAISAQKKWRLDTLLERVGQTLRNPVDATQDNARL